MSCKDTVEAWLLRTAVIAFERDFAAFRERVLLPIRVSTLTGSAVLSTDDELAQVFFEWIELLGSLGVDQSLRHVEEIVPDGPNRIRCRYTSELLREGMRVCPAYRAVCVLEFHEGVWKAQDVWVEVENRSFPLTAPRIRKPRDEGDATARLAREKTT